MGKFIKGNWFKLVVAISILIIGISIAGYFYISEYHDKKLSEQEAKQQVDYFNKKIECEKYTDSISKKINQFNASQKPEFRDSNNSGQGEPMYNLYIENNVLKEVFYSPKINSCLYLESRRTLVKPGANAKADIGNWSVDYETYYLVDVLTSKEIDFNKGLNFLQIIHRGEQFNSEKEADDILNEYR